MNLLRMESYKILCRRGNYVLLGLLFVFYFLYLFSNIANYRTQAEGNVYEGIEAIQKDREIAAKFSGTFTLEKAHAIIEQYGLSGYLDNGYDREGNFSSRFVTNAFTDVRRTQELPEELDLESAPFYEKMKDGNVIFSYMEGWDMYMEFLIILFTGINIWVIIVISGTFTEEYEHHTAEVILTTIYGKEKGIRIKILAAAACGSMVFWGSTFFTFILVLFVYGGEGLGAGIAMSSYVYPGINVSIGTFMLLMVLSGYLAFLLNIGIVLWFSSAWKKRARVITAGVISYLAPFLLVNVVYQMMGEIWSRGWLGAKVVQFVGIIGSSMPVYLHVLPENFGFAPAKTLVMMYSFAAGLTILAFICIYRNARKYKAG